MVALTEMGAIIAPPFPASTITRKPLKILWITVSTGCSI